MSDSTENKPKPSREQLEARVVAMLLGEAGPFEASTCGGSHKPCRSFNVGVKGWSLAGRHAVDHPGPNAARNALGPRTSTWTRFLSNNRYIWIHWLGQV